MIRAQIQVPEELLKELRTFAKKRDWSLAETFRRGAELLLEVCPDPAEPPTGTWTAPSSTEVGWMNLSATQLRKAAFADGAPQQP